MVSLSLATAKAAAVGGVVVASLSAFATFLQYAGGEQLVPLLIGSLSVGGIFASGGAFFVLRQQTTAAHLRTDKHSERLEKISEAITRIDLTLAKMDGYRAGADEMAATLADRLGDRMAALIAQSRNN